jgi:hypothetical protein
MMDQIEESPSYYLMMKQGTNGFIIDPTVQIESSLGQAEHVNLEKQGIHNPCLPDLRQKYNLKSLEVTGIFVGVRVRGTYHNRVLTKVLQRSQATETIVGRYGRYRSQGISPDFD